MLRFENNSHLLVLEELNYRFQDQVALQATNAFNAIPVSYPNQHFRVLDTQSLHRSQQHQCECYALMTNFSYSLNCLYCASFQQGRRHFSLSRSFNLSCELFDDEHSNYAMITNTDSSRPKATSVPAVKFDHTHAIPSFANDA